MSCGRGDRGESGPLGGERGRIHSAALRSSGPLRGIVTSLARPPSRFAALAT